MESRELLKVQIVSLEPVCRVYQEGRACRVGEPTAKGLTSLPPEVLELVYHHLDSIDDVHSFGRAHSKTYHIIKRQTVYTEIMRSIIGRSWAHRYDLQLCNIIQLHRDVVRHFQQHGQPFPVSSEHSGQGYNEWESRLASTTIVPECAYGPCAACIPDVLVYDILARYQGMRMLEDIWLSRQLEETDLLAADATQDEKELVRRYACVLGRVQDFEQGDLEARSMKVPATHGYTKLNSDQRGRFHSAVTFVWILNELRWVLTNFVYPSRSHRHIQILDRCRADFTGLCHNPLLDQLDQHAVFAFMYHHLLPLHSPVLQDQNSSKLPLTFNTEWLTDGAQSSKFFQLFLLAGQTYFQPPDLIDLVVRHKISQSAPYPEMTLPTTTEQWVRPSKAFTFPADVVFDDYTNRFTQLFNTHISLINRSSFIQSQANNINHAFRRSPPTSSSITDLAGRYFIDSAVAAIEKGESYKEGNRPARDMFSGEWQNLGMWSVWWWANSEDKARAIIARWGEKPKTSRDRKTNVLPGMPHVMRSFQ
ncbi:hypothetical protein BU25DRAFT_406521 [Macroventuria anomochaeta]|uniref:Uncharacterized protein n=1 Tax=Macroventuria anomochaeta TaxID=301207 RepID=A0ACB6SD88_9PLEO|nr:uncharacterized protein BU25DRAFT_406521 [Macroventuria anomochaeta]KAF2631999.1 hypothetical protein BU25DRAFT_406521 [Macroventuria anomochaeta]